MPSPFTIVRYTIDPVTPTEIRAPFDCSNVTIEQEDLSNAARIVAIDGGYAYIQAGGSEQLSPPKGDSSGRCARWQENALIVTAYAQAGTGPLAVRFCQ